MLVVAVVPLTLVAVLVTRIQRRGLAVVEADLELAVADQVSREINAKLGEAQRAVHRTATTLSSQRIASEDDRLAVAHETIATSDIVDWVAVFSKDGTFIGSIEKDQKAETRALSATARSPADATPGVTAWIHDWVDGQPAEPQVRLVEALVADGVITGYVLGVVRMRRLDETVTDLSLARFGRPDRILIVDADRRIVSGGASKHPRGASLANEEMFRTMTLDPNAFANPVDVRHSWVGADGVARIGTVRTLPSQKWAVVVERPEAEAFQTLAESERAFALSALGVAVLAIAFGSYLASRTTRPIGDLVALTRAFAERRWGTKSKVHTNDELGVLGQAMETMASDLAATEAEVARRAKVEAGLARYLPDEVANVIAKGEDDATELLASRRADVTVLFADVAAFTPFAERAKPEDVVALLNELFSLLSEIVFRHGGMVDKFMGDCIMAVFGVRTDGERGDHVSRALAAAEDMQRFVEASASRWRGRFDVEVKLGIGIATGEVLVGNLGSDRRMEFTTIGDSVNVASRLEGLAAPGQVLVTSAIADKKVDGFELRSLGEHAVRGKRAPIEIFELVR